MTNQNPQNPNSAQPKQDQQYTSQSKPQGANAGTNTGTTNPAAPQGNKMGTTQSNPSSATAGQKPQDLKTSGKGDDFAKSGNKDRSGMKGEGEACGTSGNKSSSNV